MYANTMGLDAAEWQRTMGDLAHVDAANLAAMEGDADDFAGMTRSELQDIREDIRGQLLSMLPELDGPQLADAMDEGLTDAGFPLERV